MTLVVQMLIVNLVEEALCVNVDQVKIKVIWEFSSIIILISQFFKGYIGDPFVNCQLEPCSQDPCGTNAECESQGRSAICKCPRGYSGDPYTNCVRDPCGTNPCGNFIENDTSIILEC